jgi:hypothetical protein
MSLRPWLCRIYPLRKERRVRFSPCLFVLSHRKERNEHVPRSAWKRQRDVLEKYVHPCIEGCATLFCKKNRQDPLLISSYLRLALVEGTNPTTIRTVAPRSAALLDGSSTTEAGFGSCLA